ncbi:MAG: hypothetical protein KIS76_04835 [Pyrinomonadaceae bacterium]|nr:hypothetical protein [Pyrinomonadaceae bacterium]
MSNLSDIGFPVKGEQDVNDVIMKVLDHAKDIPCPNGFYLKFSDESGAQIFLQGNKAQELIGFNPHFAGTSRRKIRVEKSIERESSELDGGFLASDESGDFTFVFDVPDFRTVSQKGLPAVREIQLTAFASNDLKIFESEKIFSASQDGSSRSFAASGLFAPDSDEPQDSPNPFGKISGEITEFELKTNSMTGENFYWFLIETLGGKIDVVADSKLIDIEPEKGSIVSGQFWLSGRFM